MWSCACSIIYIPLQPVLANNLPEKTILQHRGRQLSLVLQVMGNDQLSGSCVKCCEYCTAHLPGTQQKARSPCLCRHSGILRHLHTYFQHVQCAVGAARVLYHRVFGLVCYWTCGTPSGTWRHWQCSALLPTQDLYIDKVRKGEL